MAVYVARRLLVSLLTALLSSIAVFLLVHAVPGDIVQQMLGQAGDPSAETALRAFFGLERPLWMQYLAWLGHAVHGDLGTSWSQGLPVSGLVLQAFGVTLELGLITLALATLVGLPAGLLAGMYEGRWMDHLVQGVNVVGLSAPVFWVGLVLLIGASWAFEWSPPLMWQGPADSLAGNVTILLLPVLSLGLLQSCAYAQFVRQLVVSALHEQYVTTAEAKGLPPRRIFFKHILRNIMIPIVTFMGLILIQILGGVVVTESLFALPGLGRLLVTSITGRDYPVVQGGLLLVVVLALGVNLAVDLLYHAIDPRLRS
jgi:peptide/nickel transport system permease protein